MVGVHPPKAGSQHDPMGGAGQVLGVQFSPTVHTEVAAQLICVPTEQPPLVGLQHRPVGGGGQLFTGVQVCPSVHCVLAAVHWICACWAHPPVSRLQQLPDGGTGHGFAAQVLFKVHMFAAAQLGCVVIVHPPRGWQHVPCGGRHGLGGPHPRPPVQVLLTAHPLWNVTAHPPPDVQHVPDGGQGDAAHAEPPKNTSGNTHVPCSPSTHVPDSEQHAPVCARTDGHTMSVSATAQRVASKEQGVIRMNGLIGLRSRAYTSGRTRSRIELVLGNSARRSAEG